MGDKRRLSCVKISLFAARRLVAAARRKETYLRGARRASTRAFSFYRHYITALAAAHALQARLFLCLNSKQRSGQARGGIVGGRVASLR
jgi:hypothetical protein